MKRWIALALALMALCLPATAENGGQDAAYEGEAGTAGETLFVIDENFSVWADEDLFRASAVPVGDGYSFRLRKGKESGTITLLGSSQRSPEDLQAFLAKQLPLNVEGESVRLPSGLMMTDYRWTTIDGAVEGMAIFFGEDGCVAAKYAWPQSMEEEFGRPIERILMSVQPNHTPPVTIEWALDLIAAQEECEDVYLGDAQPEAWVLFRAGAPVTDFCLLGLSLEDMDDDGTPRFSEEILFQMDALTPDRPLLAQIAFIGDIPNNGISYVDGDGVTRRYTLSESGFDGALLLAAY